MHGLGKGVRSFKDGMNEAKEEFEKAKNEEDDKEEKDSSK
jgi:sec-independent protein translocase protein TatA